MKAFTDSPSEKRILERTRRAGQGQLLRWYDSLDAERRAKLLAQLEALDFDLIARLVAEYLGGRETPSAKCMRPAAVIRLPQDDRDRDLEARARRAGEERLAAGEVGLVTVAGGQGTRLRFEGPKGAFPIGPVSRKCIFALHAEKIRAISRRYRCQLPWYIMTSPANRDSTQELFKEHDYFGLAPDDVTFFVQGVLPAVDKSGRVLLADRDRLATSPDGHGGLLEALRKSGALAQMEKRSVKLLFYFQVDNPILSVADPVFLGYHVMRDCDMSLKVLKKRDAHEPVGVVCEADGGPRVIEYSELADDLAEKTDERGGLSYWAGSIAIHGFSRDFLERSSLRTLPFHRALKEVAYIADDGEVVNPAEPNAVKFERFIFDVLPWAKSWVCVETRREVDFAPVKNAEGEDSPATARQAMMNLWASWLDAAGHRVPRDAKGNCQLRLEISPLYALDAAELAAKVRSDLKIEDGVLLEE